MTKVLAWLRPRGASLDELRAQHDHAQAAHEAALKAIVEAKRAFDDSATDASRKALQSARESAVDAADNLQRAVDLRAEAEAAHADAERKQRERRVAEIEALLADRTRVAELDAAEVARWLAIVEARQARHAESQRRVTLEFERREIMFALGDSSLASVLPPSSDPGVYQVAEALMAEATKSGPGARQAVLLELARPLLPPVHVYNSSPVPDRIPNPPPWGWGRPLLGSAE